MTFKPHPLLTNPHLQTLGVNIFPSKAGFTFTRQRIETPDGDFLDLDTPHIEGLVLPETAPLVLVVHGLEGDARRGYMCVTYREMAKVGIRTIGLNLRGCSGEVNRKPQSYHLGATDDIRVVHDWLDQTYRNVPKAMIGYSLGANLTLKYLGENGASLQGRLVAGIAISPPFNLLGVHKLSQFPGTIYANYLLIDLHAKVQAKLEMMQQAGIDVQKGLTANRLSIYDDAVTAPLHGFKDADDYYAKTSSEFFLAGIAIPTLIIRAIDDPFFRNDIPHTIIDANPNITGIFPAHGGHCAFIEGIRPSTHVDWAQKTSAEWVKPLLKQ